MPRTFRRKCAEQGFSLMEVLVSMAILGITFASLFSLISASLNNIDRIENKQKMIRLGQMKLNELTLNASLGNDQSALSGNFDDKLSWQAMIEMVSSSEETAPSPAYILARIRLLISWPHLLQENQYSLETLTWVPVK